MKKDEARRGFVLAAPGSMKAFIDFAAKIYVLTKKEGGRHKPFVTNYKPQFFFRTAMLQELYLYLMISRLLCLVIHWL